MKKSWLSLSTKFDALKRRERWMVACALFAVVFAAMNSLFINPVLARQKIISSELATDQAQIQNITQQISAYSNQAIIDPDASNNQRITELNSHLKTLETQLSGLQNTLISPDKIPELLRSLLKKNGKLQLIELKTLPTKGLLEAEAADKNTAVSTTENSSLNKLDTGKLDAGNQDSSVYKHGVEITVEGHYLDLLEYVSDLEKMPWHVLWSKAALNEEQLSGSVWPTNRLKLTVYTLSLDKTWLSI
ncbi:MSHA biogenesis protein MshJ [Methylotenera sp.]|uniref:MSHA biogenesis protein MshJ n=1 Tax=Methylotenera sp. TaxID=2051956 RepID=UPI00248A3B5E|nr:MSHA biogenesis protein MshJ [Methylotenera sp.]MDI1299662.1 MSHA biogenesis protein MshJ [Methylotenera sp.]